MVFTPARGIMGLQSWRFTAAILIALTLAGTTELGQLPTATVLGVVEDSGGIHFNRIHDRASASP